MWHYSKHTIGILLAMIVTGAARIVSVKLFYQLQQFDGAPLVVTLLYLLGQSLSLGVYWLSSTTHTAGFEKLADLEGEDAPKLKVLADDIELSSLPACASPSPNSADDDDDNDVPYSSERTMSLSDDSSDNDDNSNNDNRPQRRGSFTGLTPASSAAASWIHTIPWYLQPTIPAVFNLLNSSMRLASLVYVAASTAEMLNSSLELILSVAAARWIRQRQVSTERWMGVGVVVVGLMLVAVTTTHQKQRDDDDDSQWIGLALIVGQCITSVLQDIAEELFLQESDYPPTLLLGMEGLIGLIVASLLYIPLLWIHYGVPDHLMTTGWGYALYLTLLFGLTAVLNILATAVTSSMTRNVWKNFRTLLVWIAGLLLSCWNLGEPWRIPQSLIVPAGSVFMFAGVYLYYRDTK